MEHLRRGVAIESLTPTAQGQLQSLFSMSEHACDLIAQHRILESLAFEGMYTRYETVDDAHYKTLRWIFNDDDDEFGEQAKRKDEQEHEQETEGNKEGLKKFEYENKKKDEAKVLARELLMNWLSSGTGIFHISGKLGSGKSTMMKHLCGHDGTKYFLKEWAGKFTFLR